MSVSDDSLKYKLIRTVGALDGSTEQSWTKELNVVQWGVYAPKYDLRAWNRDHSAMRKGLTLTREELTALRDAIDRELTEHPDGL